MSSGQGSRAAQPLGTPARAAGPVTIVGGGISGLSAAHYLNRGGAGSEVSLLEGKPRFGGNIRTERVDGFLFDVGPDSFLRTRPDAVELCRELGLEEELLTPRVEGRAVFIAHEGRLERMPEGLSLGVPMNLGALLDCPSLSPLGKARAMLEPFLPVRRRGPEESIFAFMQRRLGPEAARRLAAPLLSGVFAGDPERLSMEACFPQLVGFERRSGSLLRGMLHGRSWTTLLETRAAPSPFVTPRAGLERLIERLVETLPAAALHSGVAVERVEPIAAGYRVVTSAGVQESAALVLAVPPWTASALLAPAAETGGGPPGLAALARELGEVTWSTTATVFFAFDSEQVEHSLEGSGFIVPEGEGRILAATWISSKWADRAPGGKVLLRAFIGGVRSPEQLDLGDDEVLALALGELRRFMGRLEQPLWGRVYRYRRGNPQPELGHLARLARVRELLSELPGLFLVGAGYGGVGIPDCVRQAREAAGLLLEGPRAGQSPSSGVV